MVSRCTLYFLIEVKNIVPSEIIVKILKYFKLNSQAWWWAPLLVPALEGEAGRYL